jgi:hypothetical protein
MMTDVNLYDLDMLLREDAAAHFLGFTVRALQAWRVRGGGPVFVKISSRAVRYRKGDLIAWTESLRRTSTSDRGNGAVA